MKYSEVKQFLNRIKTIKILVVGDLMIDEYLWGKTERISPEAPVQVVDVKKEDIRLGGAGNVLNNLMSLGCQVHMASVVGDEPDGHKLKNLLVRLGISSDTVLFEKGRRTSRKTRILCNNQQMLRVDRESREPIGTKTELALLNHISEYFDSGNLNAIIISDYLKGVLTEKVLKGIINIGNACGVPLIVDPKGDDYKKYLNATLLTPNRKEAQIATKISITDDKNLCLAGHKLLNELNLKSLLITSGEDGMILFKRGEKEFHLSTQAKEVYDVSGAGDTVISVIGAGIACGLCLEDAAALANMAAGAVVGKVGTSPVLPEDLLNLCSDKQEADIKIKSVERLEQILDSERKRKKSVVFTNGCFDLLHIGHVKYLQRASQLGDILILGLNSDLSVRRLKGPKRPLLSQEERAHILAALDCIDYIVIFNEDTPVKLINKLRPDIIVKGGDYIQEKVIGKELVESYGGCVELVNFVDGISTTKIIEKILQQYHN